MSALSNYSALASRATPAIWEQAANWYGEAYGIAGTMVPLLRQNHNPAATVEHAAAVLAAFSPRSHWLTNVRRALEFANGRTPRTMASHVAKALEAVRDGVKALTGPKTRNFALNILGDPYAVTIDTHMVQAAGLSWKTRLTPKLYAELADGVREVARTYDVSYSTAQAAIWIVQRKRAL